MKAVDFKNILKEEIIKEAFRKACFEKIVAGGYCDLNPFIKESMASKPQVYSYLEQASSRLLSMFARRYHDDISEFSAELSKLYKNKEELTAVDANAIVFYMYRAVATNDERIACTEEVLQQWNEYIGVAYDLKDNRTISLAISHNVLYDENMVSMYYIDSVSRYSELMNEVAVVRNDRRLFFRGHENIAYGMQPGLFRNPCLAENENRMYQEMHLYCADEFRGMNHLDVLAKMQLEGLATRLYTLTSNPMVALYFACGGESNTLGEFIIYQAKSDRIMYPQSDDVSVLATLPLFAAPEQKNLYDLSYLKAQKEYFSADPQVERIVREVRSEIPGFKGLVDPKNLREGVFVIPSRADRRIDKQDVAYILCGLLDEVYGHGLPGSYIADQRLSFKGKKILCLIDNKKRIRRQLETLGVNHSSLFPDIRHMASYVNEKYGRKN